MAGLGQKTSGIAWFECYSNAFFKKKLSNRDRRHRPVGVQPTPLLGSPAPGPKEAPVHCSGGNGGTLTSRPEVGAKGAPRLFGNGTGGKASGPGKGTGRRNASGVAVGRGGVRSGVGCWGWGRGRRPRGVGLRRAEELRQLGLQGACDEPAGRCVNKGTVHEVPQTEKKNFGNCWEQQLPKRPPFLLLFAPPGTGGGVTYILPRTSHSPPPSQGEGRLAVPGSRVTRNAKKRPKCFLTFGAGSLWWFFTDCTERSLGQD